MRMNRMRAILSILCTLTVTAMAIAAEHGAEGEGDANLFAGDIGNAIWTLAIFVLVLVVLGKYAWGPMLAALQSREKFIRESLETARRDRESAEARLREYEQRLQKARDEATAIVEEGRRDAEVVKRRIEDEAKRSADDIIERARREIGIARDTALKDIYATSADLAMNMASTVLNRQITAEDQQALIRDALAKMNRTGEN